MATCVHCGKDIPEGAEVVALSGEDGTTPVTLCAECGATTVQTAPASGAASASTSPSPTRATVVGLLVAVALGLGACVISALVWYGVVVVANYQLGILAIGVGWLVARAVMLGAGNQRGLVVQLISVAITALAMVLSEYLIVRHFVAQALADTPGTLRLFLPPAIMADFIIEGIKADPMTLLFWAIALWEAFSIPRRRRA